MAMPYPINPFTGERLDQQPTQPAAPLSQDEKDFQEWMSSQSGYIGKTKKAEWWANRKAQNEAKSKGQSVITTGIPTGDFLSGTGAEQQGQLAGLNLAALGFGQGLGQTGQEIQEVRKRMKARASQSAADPTTAGIMGTGAANVANAQRQLQAQNVRGAAAARAIASANKRQDAEVKRSLYGQSSKTDAEERSFLGNILSGTMSTMQGERMLNAPTPSMPTDTGGGILGDLLKSLGLA